MPQLEKHSGGFTELEFINKNLILQKSPGLYAILPLKQAKKCENLLLGKKQVMIELRKHVFGGITANTFAGNLLNCESSAE